METREVFPRVNAFDRSVGMSADPLITGGQDEMDDGIVYCWKVNNKVKEAQIQGSCTGGTG